MRMVLKRCDFCDEPIDMKIKTKRFCNVFCQRKKYNQKPEVKEKARKRIKRYRKTHPEWKIKHRILAITKYRKRRQEYWKEYGKRTEVRARINKKNRIRRKTEKKYAIIDRLRRSLNHAMTKYSKTGKIMSSKKYWIEWDEVINSLKPFPKNIKDFEIDHIIPLDTFGLTRKEQVTKAFSPLNLQWLTREENRRKGGKILKGEIHNR